LVMVILGRSVISTLSTCTDGECFASHNWCRKPSETLASPGRGFKDEAV
jgi:hypothetical protein